MNNKGTKPSKYSKINSSNSTSKNPFAKSNPFDDDNDDTNDIHEITINLNKPSTSKTSNPFDEESFSAPPPPVPPRPASVTRSPQRQSTLGQSSGFNEIEMTEHRQRERERSDNQRRRMLNNLRNIHKDMAEESEKGSSKCVDSSNENAVIRFLVSGRGKIYLTSISRLL